MHERWFDSDLASPADLAACRETLRRGSRSFYAAAWLLPEQVRAAATAIYAFCRLADDIVDLEGGRSRALARLCERLNLAYAGRPLPLAIDRAFADTVARHALPRALPEALLEGLEWDAAGRRYASLDELYAYAARVAGAVGVMMAVLMGVREPRALARAGDLGVAMQLSNIARDVGEDARAGRLYLPIAWLAEVGIDAARWLDEPVHDARLALVVRRLLDTAEALYVRATGGIAWLPRSCRPGILAARLLYAEIGRELERRRLDPVSGRAVVPTMRKIRLLGRAFAMSPWLRKGDNAPPLPANQFLIDAVREAVPWPARANAAPPRWELEAKVAWTVELFHRLDERRRGGAVAASRAAAPAVGVGSA